MAAAERRDERLAEALARVSHVYDWAVVDCGPSMNLLAINAIRAADTVIIPVETGFFSIQSVGRARETVELVAKRTGHQAQVVVVPTMYDPRTKSDRAAYRQMRTMFADDLSETTIRFNAKLKEAAAAGSPINEFFPGCRGHQDYQALAQELMSQTLQFQMAEGRQVTQTAMATQVATLEKLTEDVLGPQIVADGVHFAAKAPGAKRVQLAGTFNNWNPEAGNMVPSENNGHFWRLRLPMAPGRHEYRLVVDGRWAADPANPVTARNEFGEFNSVIDLTVAAK
jgi:hypothetical protein